MHELLAWMHSNPNLSGWAQAAGGFLGILIAVAIPYFQRASQIDDEKRKHAQEDLAQSQGTYFLIVDTLGWLIACKATAAIPRNCGALDRAPDLLARARALDAKESDGHRVIAVQAARDVIVRTNGMLNFSFKLEHPLTPDELAFIEKDLEKMKEILGVRHDALLLAEHQFLLSKASWFKKPFLQYEFKQYRALKNAELDAGISDVISG